MDRYVDPNAKLKFREKPYLKMQVEERAYVINNLFRQGYLTTKDVRRYVFLSIFEPFVWASVPLLTLASAPTVARLLESATYRVPSFRFRLYLGTVWFVAVSSLWNYWNPATIAYKRSQRQLMDYIDYQLGDYVFDYNAMLPRRWTQTWINWKTVGLYFRRRYFPTPLLTPPVPMADIVYDYEAVAINDD